MARVTERSDDRKLTVYISYSRRDAALADRVAAALERRMITVLLDRRDVAIEASWQKELLQLIRRADRVLWIVTPNSLESKVVAWEVDEAARMGKLVVATATPTSPADLPAFFERLNHVSIEEEAATHFETQMNLLADVLPNETWTKEATRPDLLLPHERKMLEKSFLTAAHYHDPGRHERLNHLIPPARARASRKERRRIALWLAGSALYLGGVYYYYRNNTQAVHDEFMRLWEFLKKLVSSVPEPWWIEWPLIGGMVMAGASSLTDAKDAASEERDIVDCSVFAPDIVERGSSCLVHIFLHKPAQAGEVEARVQRYDDLHEMRGAQILTVRIPDGTVVSIELECEGLEVRDPKRDLAWWGTPTSCAFVVKLPAETRVREFFPSVRVRVNGVEVGRIDFVLRRGAAPEHAYEARMKGDYAIRYRKVFLSYSSQDRHEVLKYAELLDTLGIQYFQDILKLEPGDRWKHKLYHHIHDCDQFVLFWSRAAAKSKWVNKEAKYAVRRQLFSRDGRPDIKPMHIDPPPHPKPPRFLRKFHFSDRIGLVRAGLSAVARQSRN